MCGWYYVNSSYKKVIVSVLHKKRTSKTGEPMIPKMTSETQDSQIETLEEKIMLAAYYCMKEKGEPQRSYLDNCHETEKAVDD